MSLLVQHGHSLFLLLLLIWNLCFPVAGAVVSVVDDVPLLLVPLLLLRHVECHRLVKIFVFLPTRRPAPMSLPWRVPMLVSCVVILSPVNP